GQALLAVFQRLVEAEQAAGGRIPQDRVIVVERDAEVGGYLAALRRPPGARFDGAHRLRHLADLAVHGARRPVELAHLVEHRTADADAGPGFEARAARRIEG